MTDWVPGCGPRPQSPSKGQSYQDIDTRHVHRFDGEKWVDITEIVLIGNMIDFLLAQLPDQVIANPKSFEARDLLYDWAEYRVRGCI